MSVCACACVPEDLLFVVKTTKNRYRIVGFGMSASIAGLPRLYEATDEVRSSFGTELSLATARRAREALDDALLFITPTIPVSSLVPRIVNSREDAYSPAEEA